MMSVFPTGDYKIIFKMTDPSNEPIMNVTVVVSFASSNRDTFG